MKQERNILENKIYFTLSELNKTGSIKILIKSDMLNDYMNKFIITKTLNQNLPLNHLSILELYHICRLINSYQHKIDVDKYFTDEEMTKAIENKNNIKIDNDPMILLKNVLYNNNNNNEESWICIVTYEQIYEWMKTGKLIYNMETQRAGILKKIGSEMIVIPYINDKSVEEISEAMLNNEFYANMISFNVAPNYNYKLEFNSTERTLLIDTKIFNNIAVTDGYHRCSGIVKALEKNPNLQGELFLKVTCMSIEKAQKFIRQESKSNVQDIDALEKYNPSNKITMFIKNINEMGTKDTNALYRKIDMGVNTHDTWIMFENFKEGLAMSGFLEKINETNSTLELTKMEKFIVKFFDNFYKITKENNIEIEELNDPTFIMGLLITCYKHLSSNEIDIEAIDKFIKKFKHTKVKYTYDYPLKFKDKRNMISKFSRLLEG